MNRIEVIEIAKKAGYPEEYLFACDDARMMRFAAEVERRTLERAAKVSETLGVHPALNVWAGGPDWYKHGKSIAAAIRALGEK